MTGNHHGPEKDFNNIKKLLKLNEEFNNIPTSSNEENEDLLSLIEEKAQQLDIPPKQEVIIESDDYKDPEPDYNQIITLLNLKGC